MAETYHHYTYSCIDDEIKFEKVGKEISKAYKRAKVEMSELAGGEKKSKAGFFTISLKADPNKDAIRGALSYLSKLPSISVPYTRIEFDHANEALYYVQSDKELIVYNDELELQVHLESNAPPTIEPSFYEKFGNNHSTLLVRVTIPNKKVMSAFHSACLSYTREKSAQNYASLKTFVDTHISKSMGWETDFPSYTYGSERFLGNPDFARSLVFCEAHSNFLFLGYSFDTTVHIDINQEDNGSPFCIRNMSGKQLSAMIDMLWAISQRGVRAKFRMADYKNSNLEGYFSFNSDYLLYKETPVSNDMLWPS